MTEDSSASSSVAQIAADKLWQFQLRKENKAILDVLQENEKKRKSLLEANHKRFEAGEERILILEKKIAQLQQEYDKKLQALERFKSEQRAQTAELKMQIKLFLKARGILTEDEIRTIKMDKVQTNTSANQPLDSCRKSITRHQNSNFCNFQTTRPHSPPVLEGNSSQMLGRSTRSRVKELDMSKHCSSRIERRAILQPLSSPYSTNSITTSKLPRLSQGKLQLKMYYEQASSIRASASSPEQSEIEFVNSFIKGISNQKSREKIISELQQIHPSKQKKDGRVEILCSWVELGESIKDSYSLENKKIGGSNRKQRLTHPRNQIETGSN